jgi:tRNA threonylcarbamoyladenosine biosynthesis protein TsaB
MNLLAIDSFCPTLSIAVSRNDDIYYSQTEAGVKHSEIVMDCIDALVKSASIAAHDLDGILCMDGPGSFTGLRIGFSIAKGLSLALSVPFMPVPTMDCIAYPFRGGGLTLTVVESGKLSWFFAIYCGEKCLMQTAEGEVSHIAGQIENLNTENITLTGPGAASLYEKLPQSIKKNLCASFEKRGYAKELIFIAKKDKLLDNVDNTALYFLGPQYFKKTDAELNLL